MKMKCSKIIIVLLGLMFSSDAQVRMKYLIHHYNNNSTQAWHTIPLPQAQLWAVVTHPRTDGHLIWIELGPNCTFALVSIWSQFWSEICQIAPIIALIKPIGPRGTWNAQTMLVLTKNFWRFWCRPKIFDKISSIGSQLVSLEQKSEHFVMCRF